MRNLIIHPQAQSEITDAYKWYRIRSQALGYDFLRETNKSIYAVTKLPLHYPMIEENIRRIKLYKFPYNLYFALETPASNKEEIIILACLHERRDPKLWQERQNQ